jgi:FixJ family two-component response regulator
LTPRPLSNPRVLLDPNVSGAKLAHDLIVHAPHLKILLISGYTQEKLDAETRTIPFLQKPFTHQALLDSLAALQSPPTARARSA